MPCCINSLVKNCCFVCDPFEIQNDFFRDMKSERRHILMIFHATRAATAGRMDAKFYCFSILYLLFC